MLSNYSVWEAQYGVDLNSFTKFYFEQSGTNLESPKDLKFPAF
jgi:hypothetical protein